MKDVAKDRIKGRQRRKVSIRKKLAGTAERPRLTVTRSHRGIYAQMIDDLAGHTLAAYSSQRPLEGDAPEGLDGKRAAAYKVGRKLAEVAKDKGITSVVFDRNGYLFHGRVAALAQGARDGGLEF
ncbi:50S ribosomal protein L18 [bacterium]|nr:50S ribosomal protein L18 [bacterium]